MDLSHSATGDFPNKCIRPILSVEQASAQKNVTVETSNAVVSDEISIADSTTEDSLNPPITHALEALLGGLGPIAVGPEETPKASATETETVQDPVPMPVALPVPTISPATMSMKDAQTKKSDGGIHSDPYNGYSQMIPGLFLGGRNSVSAQSSQSASTTPNQILLADEELAIKSKSQPAREYIQSHDGELPPHSVPHVESAPLETSAALEDSNDEHPEWEVDSSPIESSSDESSSDDSSSDGSEESENAYKLLSPEEQAKILMEGDGASDDEASGKAKGIVGPLRTKNEVPEIVITKPDVVITESMAIVELGIVEQVVGNILLVKAKTSGEYRVLESGSVLCLADRSVIGVVAEPMGRVQQPLYSVIFTNAAELADAGLSVGIKVFYSEQHSIYVFTQALKAFKGTDASNIHDEEVADEDMEFSDDEAEAEHKRRMKQKKRGGKMQSNGGATHGGYSLPQQQGARHDASNVLSYDDSDDGPYKTLCRPSSYAESVSRSKAPEEGSFSAGFNRPRSREQPRGRGRGDRGKNDRVRGRGDRRCSRVGQDRRCGRVGQDRNGSLSMPPEQCTYAPSSITGLFQAPPFILQNSQFTQVSPLQSSSNPGLQPTQKPEQYSQFQPENQVWSPYPQQPPSQQQQPYHLGQQNTPSPWANMAPSPLAGGAFINPAFFHVQNGNLRPWNQPDKKGDQGTN